MVALGRAENSHPQKILGDRAWWRVTHQYIYELQWQLRLDHLCKGSGYTRTNHTCRKDGLYGTSLNILEGISRDSPRNFWQCPWKSGLWNCMTVCGMHRTLLFQKSLLTSGLLGLLCEFAQCGGKAGGGCGLD